MPGVPMDMQVEPGIKAAEMVGSLGFRKQFLRVFLSGD